MAYTLAVPYILDSPRFERYYPEFLRRCKAAGVQRIFLCVSMCTAGEEDKLRQLRLLETYSKKLTGEGFEVGAWFSPLGHGGTMQADARAGSGLQLMHSLEGTVNADSLCPLDENYVALCCDWVRRLAAAGARIVLLDDDFRYSYRVGGTYCCCPLHTARLEAALGEPFDAARMRRALTEGGPNRWREVWLQVQGEVLLEFARTLRAALDEVDPGVRLAHCAVLSTWDIDGADSLSLARAFAGSTRPLLRLIGAPYWAAHRQFDEVDLATVCEYERLQQGWAAEDGGDVEIFCEGDVYSRPRFTTPAAYLEGFDEVMRAAATSEGILKYMFDYTASPTYETGYYDRHLRNGATYRAIHRCFEGRRAQGLRVYEPMHTLALSQCPGELEHRCVPASLRFVSGNCLPVRYDAGGADAAVVFGDAAEAAGETVLAHGAILDAAAARILHRRGFDVGVTALEGPIRPVLEQFADENETVSLMGGRFFRLCAAPGAKALSTLLDEAENPLGPAVLRYEAADGRRYLVYAFEAQYSYQTGVQHGVFCGWCRARQLRGQLAWLSGRAPAAVADAAPGLYTIVKADADTLAVGVWNFGADTVFCPQVRLGHPWQTLLPVQGSALLAGRTVTLGDLAPFGFACFILRGPVGK